VALVFALSALGCQGISVAKVNAPAHKPHLYAIGDSTVASFPADRYPLMGWGQVLQDIFNERELRVVNAARSGRSSRSFYEEGLWEPICNRLQRGDYVFIQFGHNDSKKADPTRYTDPETSFRRYLQKYVAEARARSALPVLVTPIHRNAWEPNGRLKDTHGAYPAAMRALAHEDDVPLLDLHAITGRHFQAIGPEKTSLLFLHCEEGEFPAYPEGKRDNTHLSETGAREICRIIAKWISGSDLGIATYLEGNTTSSTP
jgi:lysophospholipase L1-like esterase